MMFIVSLFLFLLAISLTIDKVDNSVIAVKN